MKTEQMYLRIWHRRLGAYVHNAMVEWENLCFAYDVTDSDSIWFEAGKLDFIKLFSRALFWEEICLKNGNWRSCSGKYYLEFFNIYDGWRDFILSLPKESETYDLFSFLLHSRPPIGYGPHPDSSWALAERIDWTQIRPIGTMADLALKGFEDMDQELINAPGAN